MSLLSSLKVAIVGGGTVGSTLARALLKSGQVGSVCIAARTVDKTEAALKDRYGADTPIPVAPMADAIKDSKIVILATTGIHDTAGLEAFFASLGNLDDKVVVDATNPMSHFPDLQIRWGETTSGGELLANYFPKARVYKAFNTLGFECMANADGKDLMYAGDKDAKSMEIAEAVISAVGFKPFYVGPIRYSRNLEAIAELWVHMAIPPAPARNTGRDFWFSVSGNPTADK
jgi:8-hydroxy-5-deazaflavin:NADPH oxidoreductase